MRPRARQDGVPWRTTKQLICPACGVLLAEATYQRFPGYLVLVGPDGARVLPENAGMQERRAVMRVEQAASPAEERQARDRLEFLRRNFGELVFDLRCRNGHSTLRTMPQLVRMVRRAPGQWVDLG